MRGLNCFICVLFVGGRGIAIVGCKVKEGMSIISCRLNDLGLMILVGIFMCLVDMLFLWVVGLGILLFQYCNRVTGG